jgi:hypothetical protein
MPRGVRKPKVQISEEILEFAEGAGVIAQMEAAPEPTATLPADTLEEVIKDLQVTPVQDIHKIEFPDFPKPYVHPADVARPNKHAAHYRIIDKKTGKEEFKGIHPLERALTTENIVYILCNLFNVNTSTHIIEVKRQYSN